MGEKNNSLFGSILGAKCPRCRQGNMFKYPLHNVANFASMHKECPHCKLRFEVEPGFFIGAMYVSYAMSVGLILTISLILYHAFNDPDTWVYITTIPAVIVLLLPVMFRYARVLYLYWFGGVRYLSDKE
jgi:uncharacterized protein (DUF983 family)